MRWINDHKKKQKCVIKSGAKKKTRKKKEKEERRVRTKVMVDGEEAAEGREGKGSLGFLIGPSTQGFINILYDV